MSEAIYYLRGYRQHPNNPDLLVPTNWKMAIHGQSNVSTSGRCRESLTEIAYSSYCDYCRRVPQIEPLSFEVWNVKTSPSTGNFQ